MLDHKTYMTVSTAIFAVVAIVHLLRAVYGWDLVIGGWTAPLWISWLGLIVAGVLAYSGYTHRR